MNFSNGGFFDNDGLDLGPIYDEIADWGGTDNQTVYTEISNWGGTDNQAVYTEISTWGGTDNQLVYNEVDGWMGTKQDTIGLISLGNTTLSTNGNVLTFQSNTYMTAGTARIGNEFGYTDFNHSGQRVAIGTASVWNDMMMPLDGVNNGANAAVYASFGTSGVLKVRTFADASGASIDDMYVNIELPHDWEEGTVVYPHLHWCPMDQTAGTIVVQANYGLTHQGISAAPEEGTLEFHGTCGVGEMWYNKFANSTASLDLTGYDIGSQIIFRLFRDGNHASDNYAGAVGLFTLGIHYECDSDGSKSIATK